MKNPQPNLKPGKYLTYFVSVDTTAIYGHSSVGYTEVEGDNCYTYNRYSLLGTNQVINELSHIKENTRRQFYCVHFKITDEQFSKFKKKLGEDRGRSEKEVEDPTETGWKVVDNHETKTLTENFPSNPPQTFKPSNKKYVENQIRYNCKNYCLDLLRYAGVNVSKIDNFGIKIPKLLNKLTEISLVEDEIDNKFRYRIVNRGTKDFALNKLKIYLKSRQKDKREYFSFFSKHVHGLHKNIKLGAAQFLDNVITEKQPFADIDSKLTAYFPQALNQGRLGKIYSSIKNLQVNYKGKITTLDKIVSSASSTLNIPNNSCYAASSF